ncbi:hypothetical protein A9G35_04235 [Gilliamella sp. Choc5-1]|uniref:HNH endonuclease n=1 Tax=Gilliamella sp. Choc5-1 TaxID=3120238 RepID=UPI00080E5E4F|nr:HNH endonuclease [Gilliamella apicola]OCG46942.1 hypothetical protein A9G35_04235 [Gilliamella apicola]
MIKLNRTPCPAYLSDDKVRQLTEEFINTGNSVWNKDEIKGALLKLSNYKCAYCEAKVQIEDSYMEVEHFHPKSRYKLEVVFWDNLLPSCKKCNGNKGNHDTGKEPIINPCKDDPKEHLCVEAARLYPKSNSDMGRLTIDVLNLNDKERLIDSRFDLCNTVKETLECLYHGAIDSKARNEIKGLLSACSANTAFSAITSNALHNDPYYSYIKQKFKDKNLWNEELEDLDINTKKIALDSR